MLCHELKNICIGAFVILTVNTVFCMKKTAVIATMHAKEQAIAPAFAEVLGVECVLPPTGFDSDVFGTFSGEIARSLSPLETARRKAQAALAVSSATMAIASEGTFGPHPVLGFVPADEELMYVYDREQDIEVWVYEITTDTNFAAKDIQSLVELREFAQKAGFPAHALIVRSPESIIHKGIQAADELQAIAEPLLDTFGRIRVETDMRAMHNPTRMRFLAEVAHRLAKKLGTNCPACGTGGYAVVETIAGLPCGLCSSPTRRTKAAIHRCLRCAHSHEQPFPDGIFTEDPTYCDFCNP